MISLSGVFDLRLFIGDYIDENVYFNSPLAYLPNLNDPLVSRTISPESNHHLRGPGRLGR